MSFFSLTNLCLESEEEDDEGQQEKQKVKRRKQRVKAAAKEDAEEDNEKDEEEVEQAQAVVPRKREREEGKGKEEESEGENEEVEEEDEEKGEEVEEKEVDKLAKKSVAGDAENNVGEEKADKLLLRGKVLDRNSLKTLVEQLKENAGETAQLLEKYKGKSVDWPEACECPDPAMMEKEGIDLLGDVMKMQECLSDDWEADEHNPMEQLGVLLRWWRLVRRAFAIASIFKVLEQRRNKTGKKKRKTLL